MYERDYGKELTKYKKLMSIVISVSGLNPSETAKARKKLEKMVEIPETIHAKHLLEDIRKIYVKSKIDRLYVNTITLAKEIVELTHISQREAEGYANEIKDNPFGAFQTYFGRYEGITNTIEYNKKMSEKTKEAVSKPTQSEPDISTHTVNSSSTPRYTYGETTSYAHRETVDSNKLFENADEKLNSGDFDFTYAEESALVDHYFNRAMNLSSSKNNFFISILNYSKLKMKKNLSKEELIQLGKVCEEIIKTDLLNGGLNISTEMAIFASKMDTSSAYSVYSNAYREYKKNNPGVDEDILSPEVIISRVNNVVMDKISNGGLNSYDDNPFNFAAYEHACQYLTPDQVRMIYKKHMENQKWYENHVEGTNSQYAERMQEIFSEIVCSKQYSGLSDKDKKNYSSTIKRIIEDFFGEQVLSPVYKEPVVNTNQEEQAVVGYNQEQLQQQMEKVSKWNGLLSKINGKGRSR